MAKDKMTISDLEKHLRGFSEATQKINQSSLADSDTQLLFDGLAKQTHYMFSYIIEYLEQ